MKTIHVVAAVIFREHPALNSIVANSNSTSDNSNISTCSTKQVFATQRGYGEWKDWWEFPGGKIEEGETPEEALKREIFEELATEIRINGYIDTIEYEYPAFYLSMKCYACEVVSGNLKLLEHENAVWLSRDNLYSVKCLPADAAILSEVDKLF